MTMLCLAEAGVVFTLFLEPAYAHKEEESTSGSIAAAAVGGDGDAAVMMRAWLVAVKDAFVVKFPRQQLDGIRERLTALQTGFTEVCTRFCPFFYTRNKCCTISIFICMHSRTGTN